MRFFKFLFIVAALSLVGFTAGCRGCGCKWQNTDRPDATVPGDDVIVPPADGPGNPGTPDKPERPGGDAGMDV